VSYFLGQPKCTCKSFRQWPRVLSCLWQ